MVKLVAEHGTRFWALIGAKLNGRTGKQVFFASDLILHSGFDLFTSSFLLLCSVERGGTISWTQRLTRTLGQKKKRQTYCKPTPTSATDGPRLQKGYLVVPTMP